MKQNRYLTFSLAFMLLMGGGSAVWAQNEGENGEISTSISERDSATAEPASEKDSAPDIASEDEFGAAQDACKKGHIISNSDIKDARDAISQLERSVTGRSNFDINAISEYYSLQQSIDTAIRTQPSIQRANEEIIQAEARYRQAKTAKHLKFNVGNNTTYQSRPTVHNQYVTNAWCDVLKASLSQVLTTFGQLENGIAASYLQIGVKRLDKMAAERDLAYETKQAFFNRLKADASVDVALLNLGLTKESLADANKMYKQGVMARYDVVQAELHVVEATEQLATANTNVDSANAILAKLLSIQRPNSEPVTIGLEHPEEITVDEAVTLADLKQLAAKRRFEVMALDRSREVLEQTRKSAESSNRPEVGISGDYIFSPGVMNNPGSLFQLNLYVNWQAWDGGERRAKLDEIDSQIRYLLASRSNLIDSINIDVEQAWLNFKLTDVTLRTAKKRIEAAWIFHDMARQRFLNGLGTSLEVNDALTNLNEAREAFVVATYDRNLAFSRLEHCVGIDFPNRRLTITPDMLEFDDTAIRE